MADTPSRGQRVAIDVAKEIGDANQAKREAATRRRLDYERQERIARARAASDANAPVDELLGVLTDALRPTIDHFRQLGAEGRVLTLEELEAIGKAGRTLIALTRARDPGDGGEGAEGAAAKLTDAELARIAGGKKR